MKGGPQGVAEGVAVGLRDCGCWRGEWPGVSLEVVGQGVSGGPDRGCVGCCWRVSPQNQTNSKKTCNRYFSMLFGVYAARSIILLWFVSS